MVCEYGGNGEYTIGFTTYAAVTYNPHCLWIIFYLWLLIVMMLIIVLVNLPKDSRNVGGENMG